jgi:hypothetical protein
MFTKLKTNFDDILYTKVPGLESFAGLGGKGVYHNKIWSPDSEKIYSVIPKRYHEDFYLTIMTINHVLLPHRDNDLVTTINFYVKAGKCRTVFYNEKEGAQIWQPENVITRPKSKLEVDTEVKYVKAVYDLEDVEEIDEFIAKDGEAWLLDVSEIHNVVPIQEFTERKAIALRTKKYSYIEVYEMLKETGNVV